MKRRHVLLAAGVVAAGALTVPSRALAARLPEPDLVADPARAEQDFARWLQAHDPREAVRSATIGDVRAFLDTGYPALLAEAARTRTEQLDHANRTATAYPAASHPWVNAAARRAAEGTDAELADFVRTGFAAALEQDEAGVPYDDGATQVTGSDHYHLDRLVRLDPDGTVRARAAGVSTDAELAEFLRHGWLSAAAVDRDAYRARYVADEWPKWREARHLTRTAVAVDRAAREGTAGPEAAMRAWEELRTRFARRSSDWDERYRRTRTLADVWARTAQDAHYGESPLWAFVAQGAYGVRHDWTVESDTAAERSGWWSHLLQHAEAAMLWWLDHS